MRIQLIIAAISLSLVSCKQGDSEKNRDLALVQDLEQEYKSYGAQISADNALTAAEMKIQYAAMKPGDSIPAKFTGSVNSVCKMKGCWMTLDLPQTEEDPMVKFKDYGFFVPKDISGKQVIVEGVAFIEETTVEDQRHFAEDAGKSKEEIEAISTPKKSMGFLAHGVLIKQ